MGRDQSFQSGGALGRAFFVEEDVFGLDIDLPAGQEQRSAMGIHDADFASVEL